MLKKHYLSNTVHYCRSSMPRLFQMLSFLQSPSFPQAVCSDWPTDPVQCHSHGASASTPLVYFEWSDINIASLALLTAKDENLSTFQAPAQASANQISLCKYPSAGASPSHSCNTRKVMWLAVVWRSRQHQASEMPSVKRWCRCPVWLGCNAPFHNRKLQLSKLI